MYHKFPWEMHVIKCSSYASYAKTLTNRHVAVKLENQCIQVELLYLSSHKHTKLIINCGFGFLHYCSLKNCLVFLCILIIMIIIRWLAYLYTIQKLTLVSTVFSISECYMFLLKVIYNPTHRYRNREGLPPQYFAIYSAAYSYQRVISN